MTLPSFRLRRRECAGAEDVLGRIGKEILRFPLPVPERLAVVDADFRPGLNMKAFESADIRRLRAYQPEAMALPLNSALTLADGKLRGLIDLPSLRYAIVVFSSLDDGPFASHHRDLLWKAFGLPVFEQLRGWNGRVIARECEVHDGLHFDANAIAIEFDRERLVVAGTLSGFSAEVVHEHCECGMETPRLRHRAGGRSRAAAA